MKPKINYRKAMLILIEEGVLTREDANRACSLAVTVPNPDKGTPTWDEAEDLWSHYKSRMEENGHVFPRESRTAIAVIDKMIRIDKLSHREVKDMIDWSQSHDFWSSVVLSPEKLRKHYRQMVAQRERDEKRPKEPVVKLPERRSVSEMIAEAEERTRNSVPMPAGFRESLKLRKAQ
jgi:hypothetical protein